MSQPLRVGIVGAGPRGLTVLERLVAHSAEVPTPLRIHVLDPFPPGAGRVWQTTQSPHLLMNTVVEEQTVFPDASCTVAHTGTGPSMAEWGALPSPSGEFARRADYGRYLAWSYRHVVDRAPAHVRIVHEPCTVTAIHDAPADSTAAQDARTPAQALVLSDGRTLAVDAVVLCVGHIPAALSDERADWQRAATAAGLTYLPPGLPAETPVDLLPAGEPVLIRGFGLNYFDLQSVLSHGRGGRFVPAESASADSATAPVRSTTAAVPDACPGSASRPNPARGPGQHSLLTYLPSGDEPVLVPGSRRGVPYRSKPITPEHPLPVAAGSRLQYFTRETIDRLPVRGDGLRFDAQLWPLILADLRAAWYTVLARVRRDAFRTDPALLQHALALSVERQIQDAPVHESERWQGQERSVLDAAVIAAEPALLFDLRTLLRPLGDAAFPSRAALDAALIDFLRTDLAAALAGPGASPLKSLFPVLWQARMLLKDLVAERLIAPDSVVREVRGWFEDFVSGLCDGPPPQRFAELLALAEAGLVRFAGPGVRITPSGLGESAAFVATSPAVPGDLRARILIDASSPANRVLQADDRLVRGMLDRGQLCAARHTLDDGTTVSSTGLAVTESPYRTIDVRGTAHPARFCLSLQLSSVQLGLAIAANPDSDARTLRDADAIARAVLALA